jgi:hypothetical protein
MKQASIFILIRLVFAESGGRHFVFAPSSSI